MNFNKSILAVAIAVAISTPALAATAVKSIIETVGEGNLNGGLITGDKYFGTVAGEGENGKNVAFIDINKKLVISDGTFTTIDISLQGGNPGDELKGLELSDINISGSDSYIIIENNSDDITGDFGSKITTATGNAINIKNSNLNSYDNEYPEIINNRGDITALNGHGISITENSTFNGNIANGSVARTNDDGDYQVNAAGTITGGGSGAAINLENSSMTGDIINNAGGNIGHTGTGTGIKISADAGKTASFKGNIINKAAVTAAPGVGSGDKPYEGSVAARDAGKIGGIDLGSATAGARKVSFKGNIENEVGAQIGSIHLSAASAVPSTDATPAKSASELAFNGAINNRGTINSIAISNEVTGNININLEDGSTITGYLAANANTTTNQNGGSIGTSVTNSGKFNFNSGTIGAGVTNTGKFNNKGGSILGNVENDGGKFEQSGGSIVGNVTNNKGKFEYKGGSIKGNVNNDGGTFYVKGNQTIDGDYMQTAGSTLAMGLYTETSLTAKNINLNAGSKVLIDLNAGNIYVQDGAEIELLKGNITDTNVSYEVNSSLVKIADVKRNSEGNLVLVFDRISYSAAFEDAISRYPNKINENKINNYRKMQATIDRLSDIQNNSPAASELLTLIQRKFGDDVIAASAQLAPEVSRATSSAAMGATRLSNDQIVGRTGGLASGDILDNSGMWIQALVSDGEQDNRNGEAYDVKSHGFVLGADTKLDDGLVLGAAYSFINSESTTQNSKIDSDYHMATLYGAQAMGQVLLDGQAYYAWGDNDSSRSIGTTASYDSSLYGARVGAGYQLDVAPATRLVPSLSLEASRLSVDGYTESGVGALKVDKQNFNRLELGVSTKLSKDYQLSRSTLTPSANVGAFHDFEAEAQSVTASFNIPGALTQSYAGEAPEKTRYVAGVGLDIVSEGNLTVSAEYNYNWNTDGFDANAGALKFRWDF